MSTTYLWIKVVHIIGFLMWTGSLAACLSLLRRHGSATGDARGVIGDAERKFAMSMDIGALVAIAAGLYLALGFEINWFKVGAWLHVKSTLVVLLLGIHGFTRVQVRKFRENPDATLPAFVLPVTFTLITAIIIFATVKPMT